MVFFAMTPFASSQNKGSGQRQPSASVWSKHACGPGAVLQLSSSAPGQGSLLLMEVRSVQPLLRLTGEWEGNQIAFWREDSAGPKGLEVWRGLLGIDLAQPAGKYNLVVTEQSGSGAPVQCRVSLPVRAGKFVTERLTVAPNFVEPNQEQLVRAEEETRRLRAIFAAVTPERLWRGRFRIPLDGVKSGGNFGRRRVLNGQPGSPHGGVDFPAPAGTPVHAAQRGRVVLAEPLYFSGNTVVLDHGLGVYTFYGHFLEIGVKPGEMVEAGSLLGQVGSTGRVTGPHLHWGLTVNRARVNALQIVNRPL